MIYPEHIAVDFETEAITQDLAWNPPRPVGVAVKLPGEESRYYAWGHPEGNNCTFNDAMTLLDRVWRSDTPIVFHNAKFDLSVAEVRLGLPRRDPLLNHDTMVLDYLYDPHARQAGLKERAHQLLDWPPDEQDELAEWVWANRRKLVREYGGKITRAKKGPNSAGAWISRAPGGLVGKYAGGDTDRTSALFRSLYDYVARMDMLPAYEREQRLMPILMDNERQGMRLDLERLERELEEYQDAFDCAEEWLRWRLKAPGLSFNEDDAVAQALMLAGVVAESDFKKTDTGRLSVAKDKLHPDVFKDKQVASALGYRNRLETCLKMYMLPWRDQAERRGAPRISTSWNQIRNPGGGTRTGRPSTNNPNFLNISKNFEGRPDGYVHPDHLPVPKLPLVRKFILPDEGHVFVHRDFAGQELRIAAEFEQGELAQAYRDNPRLDVHQFVADMIRAGFPETKLDRTKTKIINFRKIYGSGATGMAAELRCSIDEARTFLGQHNRALPGLKRLADDLSNAARRGEPILTWGGRRYFCEEPRWSEELHRTLTFEYKLLNYKVQGSAADLTKQAIIDWHGNSDRSPDSRFLVQVYDEINISVPADRLACEMRLLQSVMEEDRMSVPMRSDGKAGPNWGEARKWDDDKGDYA